MQRSLVQVVAMSERPVTLDARDLDLVLRALMAQAWEYRKHGNDPSPRGMYARVQSDRARNLALRLTGVSAPVSVTGGRR